MSSLTLRVCPPMSDTFPDRYSLPGSRDGIDIWMLICLSLLVWGSSLWSHLQGIFRLKNDLQACALKQRVTHSTQNPAEALFLWGREDISRELIFSPLSSRNCLASESLDLKACPEDLTSRVRAVCLPALSNPCKHNSRPYHDCPWGSRLRECVWQCWVPYCGHLFYVILHCQWARGEDLLGAPLLHKCQSVEQS